MRPIIQLTTRRITTNGDFALLSSDWRLKGVAPNGSPIESAGRSAEVGRRGPDGDWYYLIDDPMGGG
jgi:ketosteroid isomerase-like protein